MAKHSEYIAAFGFEKGEAIFKAMRKELGDDDRDRTDSVDAALDAVGEILGGSGVEAINGEHEEHVDSYYLDIILLYVNMGNPYVTTVLYDTQADSFLVGNWGGWLEAYQAEMEEEPEEERGLFDEDDPAEDDPAEDESVEETA